MLMMMRTAAAVVSSARTQGQSEKRLRHLEMNVEAEEAEGRQTRLQTAFTSARDTGGVLGER